MSDSNFFDETRKVRLPELEDDSADGKLKFLTGAILLVVVLMLLMIGDQAVKTERIFFRKVALRTNQKISDLLSQQLSQVFSNATALVEDMAQFPTVSSYDSKLCSHLFQLILKRHTVFRSFHILKTEDLNNGKNQPYTGSDGVTWEWYNTNVNSFRPLAEKPVRQLLSKYEPSQLTEYYGTEDGKGAITFACAIRDRETDFVTGILVAEIDLKFIQPVIDGADINRTGDVLVADKQGKVIFSTRGFTGLSEFNANFPVKEAYANIKGGVEYPKDDPQNAKLAAYTRIRGVTSRSLMTTINMFPFPTTVSSREIPDWLIVVVQDSAEGYLVADRMKWNIALLLIIGAVGVVIIGKLWIDSTQ